MKKLHILLAKTYFGPFIATFFISLFILLMQFLWKYIDDLVGKGLEWYIVGELLFYAAVTFVPMALPLAILLSSIMTMGKLGENYELVAFKSAGISLKKIMFPLVIISGFFVLAAFYFSNNVLPVANLKMGSLLYDVRHQRPAFNILEGVYYKGIDNYVIKADGKDSDGTTLRSVMIYDHGERRGNVNVTVADWAEMKTTSDKRYLVMTLYNGYNYKDMKTKNPRDPAKPFQRTYFKEQIKRFDLSGFDLNRTDEDAFRNNFQMLSMNQLVIFIDSLTGQVSIARSEIQRKYKDRMKYFLMADSSVLMSVNIDSISDLAHKNFAAQPKELIINQAKNIIRSQTDGIRFGHEDIKFRDRRLARYTIEFHRKFTLSFACIVLFLIGAPMGAIIRKGGYGLPMIVAVLFFVVFHVISITGEKFAREGVISAFQGMWIASAFLLPIGIWLTYKASTDSSLFDADNYLNKIKNFFYFFRKANKSKV
ncbi:MAG: LptF/LptG family permease [Bacteroidetes bacterium]|nr:LptF/LptG family permease [Bacteroidota bacterium]